MCFYILNELVNTGLHQREQRALIDSLKQLPRWRQIHLVVEH
ncbi:hypothetical protein [Duncaniella muris]